jgi:hypothetical protein
VNYHGETSNMAHGKLNYNKTDDNFLTSVTVFQLETVCSGTDCTAFDLLPHIYRETSVANTNRSNCAGSFASRATANSSCTSKY